MKKLYIIVVLIGFYSFQSKIFAQVPVIGTDKILEKLRLNKSINGPENVSYSNISGDPYIYKNFEKAKLIMVTGEEYDVNMRYDIYANKIHLQDKGTVYAIGYPEKIKRVFTDNLNFIYSKYVKSSQEKEQVDESYFIIKTDGACKLLIRKNLRIQDAEPPKLYQGATPAKFIIMDDSYFLKHGDNYAVRIKSKNDLLFVLNDRRDDISAFITSQKLNVKEVEDLDKITSFYNNLK